MLRTNLKIGYKKSGGRMRKAFIAVVFLAIALFTIRNNFDVVSRTETVRREPEAAAPAKTDAFREITGKIERGETLFDIFKKYKLDPRALFQLKEASADVYRLRDLRPKQSYRIVVDDNDRINSFVYWIDDDTMLNITSTESGLCAVKVPVPYEKRILHIGGRIKDNLISSMGGGRDNLMLALQLADVFAWDLDFTTDLRKNDRFKIVVEGLYRDGEFRKYGDILSAEFVSDGEDYFAYRYSHDGKTDYFDADGKSLRRAFLKAPLSFRRISSRFSNRRFQPILKIWRPHHGLDYAAPTGTPVSASGDGTVIFAGRSGGYGNLIKIRHRNGWKTYYGHLSRFARGIRKGKRVEQGQLIGYVGATGLATGPHLHYEMRIHNKPVNPLSVKIPHGEPIPERLMADFRRVKGEMDAQLASIPSAVFGVTETADKGPGSQRKGQG
jgi:murein DD-endopeptidase MepM/ murein hydrolase activator NlpD